MGKVKCVYVDPGVKHDPTGIVAVEYLDDTFHVKLAYQLKQPRVETLANTLADIKVKINPDVMAIETNNYGLRIKYLLEVKYDIAILGVSTSANLSAKRVEVMDKPGTIHEMLRYFREGRLKFPARANPNMKELMNQIEEIESYRKDTGTMTYRRTKNRHDDLFMALLGSIHLAKSSYCTDDEW